MSKAPHTGSLQRIGPLQIGEIVHFANSTQLWRVAGLYVENMTYGEGGASPVNNFMAVIDARPFAPPGERRAVRTAQLYRAESIAFDMLDAKKAERDGWQSLPDFVGYFRPVKVPPGKSMQQMLKDRYGGLIGEELIGDFAALKARRP